MRLTLVWFNVASLLPACLPAFLAASFVYVVNNSSGKEYRNRGKRRVSHFTRCHTYFNVLSPAQAIPCWSKGLRHALQLSKPSNSYGKSGKNRKPAKGPAGKIHPTQTHTETYRHTHKLGHTPMHTYMKFHTRPNGERRKGNQKLRDKCKYTNNDGEGLLSQAKKVLVNKYMRKQAHTHEHTHK